MKKVLEIKSRIEKIGEKIKITSPLAGGGGNTQMFREGDIVDVIRIDDNGDAVVWADYFSLMSNVKKKKVGIPKYQFEILN